MAERGRPSGALAVIPARGGSKSIPRKNILPLGGLPLIAHTILAARSAKRIARVIVTTDDAEIGEVARRFGAEVVERPLEIAGDEATSESAILHVLETIGPSDGMADCVVFLQCTSPLTTGDHIDALAAAIMDEGADSALTVRATHTFLWGRTDDGAARGLNHDPARRARRQDLSPEFSETGAGYAFTRSGFQAHKHRFFGRTALVETLDVPPLEIDEVADLAPIAALLATRNRGFALPSQLDLVVFDFDGVMTDDRVYVDQNGVESVACSRSDGLGVERLRRIGVPMLILSKEANPVVSARAAKLGIECLQGVQDKVAALRDLAPTRGISLKNCVFVGNDINDLPLLKEVGCPAAPNDARPEVLEVARLVLPAPGGRGAVRALAEAIIADHDRGNLAIGSARATGV